MRTMETLLQLLSKCWLILVEQIYPTPPALFFLVVFLGLLTLIQVWMLLRANAHDRKRLKDL